jgi:hypothetical protein
MGPEYPSGKSGPGIIRDSYPWYDIFSRYNLGSGIILARRDDNCYGEIPVYTVLMIGALLAIAFGVPATVWLTKLMRPPKPEEEKIHREIEAVRRRMDRFRP